MTDAARRQGAGWSFERELWDEGYRAVAGIDEVGRGAWAGPVVVAAVVLPFGEHPFVDSKRVGPSARERLAAEVRERALAWALCEADAAEVDRLGVLAATLAAAERTLRALAGRGGDPIEVVRRCDVPIDAVVTDYLRLPTERWAAWGGPRGLRHPARADAASVQVAAASIIAKVHRDDLMRRAAVRWPRYGFERHKGYGAPRHRAALERHGPCSLHRRTFRPVATASRPGGDPQEDIACPTPSA